MSAKYAYFLRAPLTLTTIKIHDSPVRNDIVHSDPTDMQGSRPKKHMSLKVSFSFLPLSTNTIKKKKSGLNFFSSTQKLFLYLSGQRFCPLPFNGHIR